MIQGSAARERVGGERRERERVGGERRERGRVGGERRERSRTKKWKQMMLVVGWLLVSVHCTSL